MRRPFFLIIIVFSAFIFEAETLWDDRAADIYSRKVYYNVGDPVQIIIDERSNVEYSSSSKTLKTYQLTVNGGEMSGLLSFIPTADIQESKNSRERDELRIRNIMEGRITAVRGNYVSLAGTKSIGINNRVNSLSVTGDAYLADISGNKINSDKLINPVFRFTTLLDSDKNIITDRDLVNEVLNTGSTSDIIEVTKLSDEKKKEILLDLFNKVLSVLF